MKKSTIYLAKLIFNVADNIMNNKINNTLTEL